MKNWQYRGVDLADFGEVTLLDDHFDVPERRGDNITIPFRHGQVHTRKYYDQRTLLLGMLLTGDDIVSVETKFRQLKTLLSHRDEGELYVETQEDQPLSAQASVSGSIQPSILGPVAIKTTIPFVLSDPFFYEQDAVDETVNIDAGSVTPTIDNLGSVETDRIEIVLTGPLENTQIVNTSNDVTLTYADAIADGDTVTISRDPASGEYTAVHSVDGNVIGNVTHSGSTALMVFEAGENSLEITDEVGTTGTVRFIFTPRHV